MTNRIYRLVTIILAISALLVPLTVSGEGETPAVIVSFDDMANAVAFAIPQGSDWQVFWNEQFADYRWEDCWPCYTEDGEELYAHITWQDPQPDTSQTGVVEVRGVAVLPDGAVLSDGLELPEISACVSIQAEGQPELNCWYIDRYSNCIILPWVSGGIEDDESLRFLMSQGNGEWEESDVVDTNGDAVFIMIKMLTDGTSYRVKAQWDGGETGVFSFTWDGQLSDPEYYEGDRDGGDTGGNAPENVTQTAPAPTATPTPTAPPAPVPSATPTPEPTPTPSPQPVPTASPEPTPPVASYEPPVSSEPQPTPEASAAAYSDEPQPTPEPEPSQTPEPVAQPVAAQASSQTTGVFYEEVTQTSSLLSGLRLRMMRESGAVRFSKQGVTVTLSDAALDDMGLTDDSRFFVEVRRTQAGFGLTVELDGAPIAALPDTAVILPFTPADGVPVLLDEEGNAVCEGEVDPTLGTAAFTVHRAGGYVVAQSAGGEARPVAASVSVPVSGHEPGASAVILPVVLLTAAVVTGGLLFVRRRR